MKNITFITGNPNKALEIERNLGFKLPHESIDLEEIQSLDIEEVVRHKAMAAYVQIGKPVLVEDSALVFHALGKLPGTYVKWFLDEIGLEGMCKMLDGFEDRSATAIACFGLYNGTALHTFVGSCEGFIVDAPRDGEGFGFDYIFAAEGYEKTWSELGYEEKDKMSHRSRAVSKLRKFLNQQTVEE